MIRKTHIALICALLSGMLSANAQVNDTVRVEFNENSRIEYIFKEPQDFAVFEQVNLDSITRELASQVKAIPYGTDTVISLSDGTVKTEERERFEALEISGTIGASLVRHKLVPHYGLRIGVSVGYKEPSIVKTDNDGVKMTIFGEYQHLMFFERAGENDYSSFGNGFANLGFMARSKDNRGMGLTLGYLVNQNGSYFGENTMKLEFHVSTKKSLSMSPFIIATDNFRSFIPGVRIGFF